MDCRKVAIAAAAAFWLFAASAQAGITDFQLDPVLSSLTMSYRQDVSDITLSYGANAWTVPPNPGIGGNPPGHDGTVANYSGHMSVNIGPGGSTVQFLPGQNIVAALTGNYNSGIDVKPGNYGLLHPNSGTYQRIDGLQMSPVSGSAQPVDPILGTFPLGNTVLGDVAGHSLLTEGGGAFLVNQPAYNWPLAGGVVSVAGNAIAQAFGQTVVNVGQTRTPLAGSTGVYNAITNTIVINVSVLVPFTYAQNVTVPGIGTITNPLYQPFFSFLGGGPNGLGAPFNLGGPNVFPQLIGTDYKVTGTLVMTAVVPEPSSMILLGFGAVGLVGCAYRARKRRTLAA